MNVTVTLTASPELLSVLNKLADNFGGNKSDGWKPVGDETFVVNLKPEKKTEKIKAPQKDAPAAEAPVVPITTATEPAPEQPLTREIVRAKAVGLSKSGHKDAIKKKIKELGSDNLDALAEDKFTEFMMFLNTL